jgi:hypothetical protein
VNALDGGLGLSGGGPDGRAAGGVSARSSITSRSSSAPTCPAS